MNKGLAVAALAAIVSGCSAAGPAGTGSLSNTIPPPKSQIASVAFDIAVPTSKGAQLRRVPNYVSSATKSAAITVTPNGGSAGAPVTVNCTSSCSGTVNAPVGSDTFSIQLFDAQNGTGHVLSTGTLTQTIVADTANSVNVTFNGVVASLSVSMGASASAGTSGSIPVTVDALDAAGKTIIGPGVYVNAGGTPITVSLGDSDASGATSLSATSLTQPTSGITLSYSGLAIAPATISASASGVTTGTASFAPTLQPIGPSTLSGGVYLNANGASSPVTFTASETGWTDAPYNKSLTATLSPACGSIATSSPSSGTTFALTLVASPSNGSCTLTLSDGAGQSLVVPVAYESYAYMGSIATLALPSGVTSINITALGAGGGGTGGAGAGETGTFTVTSGATLTVLVGGAGGTASNVGGGGGGGSFVYLSGASTPLIAAGGGGGGSSAGLTGGSGSTSTSGVSGGGSGGTGGSGGSGGSCVTNSGGGGGWLTGGTACNGVPGGASIRSGGAGGTYVGAGSGGFGGGGAGADTGGGGGGYSGGGGGGLTPIISPGGGGGSYNAGTSNMATPAGATAGNNGSIVITW